MRHWIVAAALFGGVFALLTASHELDQSAGANMLEKALASNNYCKWPNLEECTPGMYYVDGPDVPSLLEYIEQDIDHRFLIPTEACEYDRLLTYINLRKERWEVCRLDEFPTLLGQQASIHKAIGDAYNGSNP